jgi:hypothetical protein
MGVHGFYRIDYPLTIFCRNNGWISFLLNELNKPKKPKKPKKSNKLNKLNKLNQLFF